MNQKPSRIKVISENDLTEAIIKTIRQPLVVLDSNLKVIIANQAYLQMTGLSTKKLIGLSFPQVQAHAWQDEELITRIANVLTTRESFEDYEFRHESDDGVERTILISAQLLVQPDYIEDRVLLAIEDVTKERTDAYIKQQELLYKQESKYLKRENKQLKELSRSKDEFVALASHQLRTPATAVKQYIALVLQGYAEPVGELQQKYLETAYEANERQIRIINDILRISSLDLGRVRLNEERVNLVELIDTVVLDIAPRMKKKEQVIIWRSPKKKLFVCGDKEYLRVAISNVVANSSDYSPEISTIVVELHENESMLEISVVDSGVGISKRDVKKLFTKFSRIHNEFSIEAQGTGLGLYWSREILRLHGGDITVESEPGNGSRFTCRLPQMIHAAP